MNSIENPNIKSLLNKEAPMENNTFTTIRFTRDEINALARFIKEVEPYDYFDEDDALYDSFCDACDEICSRADPDVIERETVVLPVSMFPPGFAAALIASGLATPAEPPEYYDDEDDFDE